MLKLSLPLRLSLNAVLNSILAYGLDAFFPAYITIAGGAGAYVIIGSLLTLMNFFLRPLLNVITFPLHLLFTLLTTVLVNVFFLWVVYWIALHMDPSVITVTMTGGVMGWITVGLTIGIVNWLMKHIL